MGGMMRILGGALQGVGSGLVAQQQERDKQTDADVAFRREQALAALRQQYTQENTQTTADLNLRNSRTMAGINATNDIVKVREEGNVRGALQNDEQGFRLTVEQLQQKNRLAIEGVQHDYRLNEDQARSAQRIAEQAAQAGTELTHFEVAKDGSMVGFTKTGRAVRSDPGIFDPNKGSSQTSMFGADGIPGTADDSPTSPAPGAPATPKQPMKPQAQQKPTAQMPKGAKQAPDGNWYVERDGKYFRVEQ